MNPIDPFTIADQAIGLFLEYRDMHGHDEESARLEAVHEVNDGLAADLEEAADPEHRP